ncbi:hypothetical protein ROJ8625_02033 [Roseivivax jejudonensis]|uniref:Glycoside hydrolase family 104 protein n=1 Tax=Roseivivax jejudonensis TaxID=1529041 RepID=A0A1X6Z5X5_9RHOB|nr:hypothetical protein [Roseivivax jejudonensis]SLN41985.1 hypothetical protein ROJ8625_02033 [Roseivivax jejudonensis]
MFRSSLPVLPVLLAILLGAAQGRAEGLFSPAGGPLLRAGSALVPQSDAESATNVALAAPAPGAGSLFSGRAAAGLFAPVGTGRGAGARTAVPLGPGAPTAARIRDLIGRAEAGRMGYDAVQHGARIKPPRAPTQMRVSDIYHWIDQTPGQPHAIGRYQFIPATLRRLIRALDIDGDARFSPALQDRLADRLLAEAGLADALAGQISRRTFMRNLARIWAGLPLPSGRSYYHGYAGNAATMSWTAFDSAMARIMPG